MSYKNGSVIGVNNAAAGTGASGVWDLNTIQEGRTDFTWPLYQIIQLLETSSVGSSSDGSWRTGTYSFTSSSNISGTTGRFVVLHYGTTSFRSDVQYDNIIIPTSGGDVTLDFESDNEDCQTTIVNVGTNIFSGYAGATFYSIDTTTTHPTAGRWYRKTGGTGSSGTGNTTDGSGNTSGYSVYTETSGTHPLSMLMRTPSYTLASSGTISWREGYWGNNLSSSTREVYWITE